MGSFFAAGRPDRQDCCSWLRRTVPTPLTDWTDGRKHEGPFCPEGALFIHPDSVTGGVSALPARAGIAGRQGSADEKPKPLLREQAVQNFLHQPRSEGGLRQDTRGMEVILRFELE